MSTPTVLLAAGYHRLPALNPRVTLRVPAPNLAETAGLFAGLNLPAVITLDLDRCCVIVAGLSSDVWRSAASLRQLGLIEGEAW